METLTLTLKVGKGRLLEVPVWAGPKERSWLAVISRHHRYHMERAFLQPIPSGMGYILDGLRLYSPIEFGADRKHPSRPPGPARQRRLYGVVIELADDHLTLEVHRGPASAVERASQLLAAHHQALEEELLRLRSRITEIESELGKTWREI